MFFLLSKIVYFLILPFSWVVLLFVFSFLTPNPRTRRRLRRVCLLLILLFSNPFLANRTLSVLEAPPQTIQNTCETGVVLTGLTRHGMSASDQFHLTEGADRITEALRLYKKGLIEKILLSGGAADLSNPNENEGIALATLALELGVDVNDIVIESRSRNTYENALYSAPLLKKSRNVLLITSAFHMPRAQRCFEKQGLVVTPYPVDYLVPVTVSINDFIPSVDAFRKWHILSKEVVGLVAYRAMGYL